MSMKRTSTAVAVLLVVAGCGGSEGAADGVPSTYLGKQDDDNTAMAGDMLFLDNTAIVSYPLETSSSAIDGEGLCTNVSILNNDTDILTFNLLEWKLQDPSGVSRMVGFFSGSNDLSSGELAPDGRVSGDVCFEGADPGQYLVIYDSIGCFTCGREVWIHQL